MIENSSLSKLKLISLKTYHNKYLSANTRNKLWQASHNFLWERFEVLNIGDNKVALKTFHGKFISYRGEKVEMREFIGPSCIFEVVWCGLKIAMKTCDNLFVSAPEDDHKGKWAMPHCLNWEQFQIIDMNNRYIPSFIALQTKSGQYLKACKDSKLDLCNVMKSFEIFNVIFRNEKYVSLKTIHGNYISVSSFGAYLSNTSNEEQNFHYHITENYIGLWTHQHIYLSDSKEKNFINNDISYFKIIDCSNNSILKIPSKIALISIHNKFLISEGDIPRQSSTMEPFSVIEHGNFQISVISQSGKYLTANQENLSFSKKFSNNAIFTVYSHLDGKISLSTSDRNYVSAVKDDTVRLIKVCKSWEKWTMENMDKLSIDTAKFPKIAVLKTPTGKYLSSNMTNVILVDKQSKSTCFSVIPVDKNKITLETFERGFISINKGKIEIVPFSSQSVTWEIIDFKKNFIFLFNYKHSGWLGIENNQISLVNFGNACEFMVIPYEEDDNTTTDQGKECAICMEAPCEVVFIPCGHVAACSACASLLNEGKKLCPICRSTITSFTKLIFVT